MPPPPPKMYDRPRHWLYFNQKYGTFLKLFKGGALYSQDKTGKLKY